MRAVIKKLDEIGNTINDKNYTRCTKDYKLKKNYL